MRPPKIWRRSPRLVRLMLVHGATGFALSAVALAVLLLADPGHARGLLLAAAGHWWPAVLLWFFLGLTFGSVQIGVATMLLAEPDPPQRPRGRPVLVPVAIPVRRR